MPFVSYFQLLTFGPLFFFFWWARSICDSPGSAHPDAQCLNLHVHFDPLFLPNTLARTCTYTLTHTHTTTTVWHYPHSSFGLFFFSSSFQLFQLFSYFVHSTIAQHQLSTLHVPRAEAFPVLSWNKKEDPNSFFLILFRLLFFDPPKSSGLKKQNPAKTPSLAILFIFVCRIL